MTWVASNLSGAAGELGDEVIELRNFLIHFGCASEDLSVVVANVDDWMDKYSPPWASYHSRMACCLVVPDKRSVVCPVGIGETLRWGLSKLVLRAAGNQAKMACRNLQMCAGLEAGIEGETNSAGDRSG